MLTALGTVLITVGLVLALVGLVGMVRGIYRFFRRRRSAGGKAG